MRDCFLTDTFVLDLQRVKISYVEQSPRFKDTFFTKYSFPFSFYMDRDLRISMGNYTDLNASNLKGKHEGWHIVEGRIHKGTLEILEVQGNRIEAQIDSGFEELPNFNKKLSELPFEVLSIPNIYQHAEEICKKKYPEVNYNFPRVIYNKHKADETGWEVFNQFINDRQNGAFVTNNESNDANTHKNRNIIHPMPYLLYVLKTGFSDAGYELSGDILEDSDFKQRVIFSFQENFTTSTGNKIPIKILSSDESTTNNGFSFFKKEANLELVGRYDYQGTFRGVMNVLVNDILVYTQEAKTTEYFNLSFDNSRTNGKVRVEIQADTTKVGSGIITDGIIRKRTYIKDGTETFQIHNLNEINLQNSVPNITFGELVTTIKNWKNYDIQVDGNKILMNRISIKNLPLVDFRMFEVESPTKRFSHKKSFLLSYASLDSGELDTAFIDEKGIKINGIPKEETTELKINGYCLPIELYRGRRTAAIKKEDTSILGLIYYDGLYNNDNYAQNPAGLHLPEILDVWGDWLKMRIENSELKWSFIAKKNALRHINIRDTLYAYGQKLWIKEITKNILNEQMYQVEIVTEIIK